MMWCKRCNDECNKQKIKSDGETQNSWKSSRASVSGRYNTPPLQEDLVPRSRMAPERNGRGREEVKLSCFIDKRMKPWTLGDWTTWKKKTEMNETANSPLDKRNKEYSENDKIANETTPVKTRYRGDKNEIFRTALQLKMEWININLIGWCLLKSTTHCLRNYWKNGTTGQKDFRRHSG